jgi:hypothetical protein
MSWQRAWIMAAGLLVVAAGVFLWRNNLSAAFVIAALGACAWFLSYRAELRSKISVDEADEDDEVDMPSDGDGISNED